MSTSAGGLSACHCRSPTVYVVSISRCFLAKMRFRLRSRWAARLDSQVASRPGTGRIGIGRAIARRSRPVGVELGSSKGELVETGSDELAREVSDSLVADDHGRDELVDAGSDALPRRLRYWDVPASKGEVTGA